MKTNIETLTVEEKEKLAENLFMSLCAGMTIGISEDELKQLNLNIMHEDGYTEFKPTLLIIVKLCTPANTRKTRELLAKAYSWLGADYREEAISALNHFLEYDLDLSNRKPYPLFVDGHDLLSIDRNAQICLQNLHNLSKAYEGEYLFDLSLSILNQAWELFPYNYTTLALKFNILKKMNNLDEIIKLIERELKEEWTQPYKYIDYFGKEWFRDNNQRCLKVDLNKYQKLLDSGYIYKSRPRNNHLKNLKKNK